MAKSKVRKKPTRVRTDDTFDYPATRACRAGRLVLIPKEKFVRAINETTPYLAYLDDLRNIQVREAPVISIDQGRQSEALRVAYDHNISYNEAMRVVLSTERFIERREEKRREKEMTDQNKASENDLQELVPENAEEQTPIEVVPEAPTETVTDTVDNSDDNSAQEEQSDEEPPTMTLAEIRERKRQREAKAKENN